MNQKGKWLKAGRYPDWLPRVALGRAGSSKNFHTAGRELGDRVAFVYTVDVITFGPPKNQGKSQRSLWDLCAISAHFKLFGLF